MPLKIEVPESHLPAFKAIYEDLYKKHISKMNALKAEWEELEPILIALNIIDSSREKKRMDNYDTQWSWGDKAIYIINKHGPLTSRQICDIIIRRYEPDIPEDLISRSMSATLSVKTATGVFRRQKNEQHEWVYENVKK